MPRLSDTSVPSNRAHKASGQARVTLDGRGYGSTPVWRDISNRYRNSGKDKMTLIVVMTQKLWRGDSIFSSSAKLADGVCGKRIIEAIDGAESTIRIASAHFRRADFAEAIQNALERDVKVQIILDAQEYDSEWADVDEAERYDDELATLGADVRYKFYSPFWNYKTALQLHCKYLIVDDSTVITGSLNWSDNSELRSMESQAD